MRRKVQVRFGGGPSEKGSGNGQPRWWPTQPLKRAAVKFGVGRYLYRLPQTWVDYDPQKKQLKSHPELPGPKPRPAPAREHAKAPAKAERRPAEPVAARAAALPADGQELQQRLVAYDAQLAKQNVCRQGELVKAVVAAGVKAGFDADLTAWSGPAILLAVEETRAFEAKVRQQPARASA
jgi:hypothetical protein